MGLTSDRSAALAGVNPVGNQAVQRWVILGAGVTVVLAILTQVLTQPHGGARDTFSPQNLLTGGIVLLGLAISAGTATIISTRDQLRRLARSEAVWATVIGFESLGGLSARFHILRLRYVTLDRQTIEACPQLIGKPTGPAVGDVIAVRYDPDQPSWVTRQDAGVDLAKQQRVSALVMGALAAVGLALMFFGFVHLP